MIGMGTPINQSSIPLPRPMEMSSVWSASAPAEDKRSLDPSVPSGGAEAIGLSAAEASDDKRYGIASDQLSADDNKPKQNDRHADERRRDRTYDLELQQLDQRLHDVPTQLRSAWLASAEQVRVAGVGFGR
jgi:hypothetical protein